MSTVRGIPAQWELQSGLLISWPHSIDELVPIESSLRQIITSTAPYQAVIIACHDAELIGRLAIELGDIFGDLRFFHAPNDSMWVRDYGPISCRLEGRLCFYDFQFNGSGTRENCEQNNRLTTQLDQQCIFQANLIYQNFVLEATNLESDGLGTLICHGSALEQSNPDYSRSEIESYLCKHLDAQQIIWLEQRHLARFINANTLVYSACDNPQDERYLPYQALHAVLDTLCNAEGEAYQLLALPLPQAIRNAQGELLPANYCDFLMTDKHVFVPQFKDSNDPVALQSIQQLCPDREAIPVESQALLHARGSLHKASLNLFAEITY